MYYYDVYSFTGWLALGRQLLRCFCYIWICKRLERSVSLRQAKKKTNSDSLASVCMANNWKMQILKVGKIFCLLFYIFSPTWSSVLLIASVFLIILTICIHITYEAATFSLWSDNFFQHIRVERELVEQKNNGSNC